MQPGAERFWFTNRPSFSGQYEEDGLCRVLGIMQIAKDVEANAANDRTVPLDESGESGLG